MCTPCCMFGNPFSMLKVGQKIKVKAGAGYPKTRKECVLTIFKIDGYSLITTAGIALIASDMPKITPLDEFVENPQLDGPLAMKRYNRF